jgi:hypothetical protein
MNPLPVAIGAAAAAALIAFGGVFAMQRTLRGARDQHSKRPALWNRFYAMNWGETTTNNYGFAPADGAHPQRFQHQLYRELLRLRRELPRELEVACDEEARTLELRRGRATLRVDFADETVELDA